MQLLQPDRLGTAAEHLFKLIVSFTGQFGVVDTALPKFEPENVFQVYVNISVCVSSMYYCCISYWQYLFYFMNLKWITLHGTIITHMASDISDCCSNYTSSLCCYSQSAVIKSMTCSIFRQLITIQPILFFKCILCLY